MRGYHLNLINPLIAPLSLRMTLEEFLFKWGYEQRPSMNKPPPLDREYNEYNRNPNIQALKRRGFIIHGSSKYFLNKER